MSEPEKDQIESTEPEELSDEEMDEAAGGAQTPDDGRDLPTERYGAIPPDDQKSLADKYGSTPPDDQKTFKR